MGFGIGELFLKANEKLGDIDRAVNQSIVGRFFRLEGSGHPEQVRDSSFLREVRAGLTTFATMAYIIAVNAAVLADSGGTCKCPGLEEDPTCRYDREYTVCLNVLKRDLITATAAIAGFSSILFGLLTNLPVALGPGMGLNAYFSYQVVGFHGTGMVPYKIALTAVFVEGFIFMFLALTGMRQWLVKMIPATIKTSCGVGIGLFLAEIGLSYTAGLGAITGGVSTPLAIGGCPPELLDAHGECTSAIMTNPAMWIGICLGGVLVAFMMAYKIKSAIIIGVALVSVISWPRDTSFSYFPYTEPGNSRFDFFKQVVAFHPIKQILAAQEWNLDGTTSAQFALALITFLYVDVIDCTATLYSMAKFCGVVKEDGDFPRSTVAYCTDAACISIGSLFGCSPVTAFIESGAGIAEGGRTGLTAISAGFCFLIALFFAPILASVPPWATGGTLVLVGCLMIRQVATINWAYIGDAVPSFVTLALMPFTYSVAYGLIAWVLPPPRPWADERDVDGGYSGMMVYVALNSMIWVVVYASGGRVLPSSWNDKEVYSFGMSKKDIPSWMLAVRRKVLGKMDGDSDSKDVVELVDNEGSVRNSTRTSHMASSEEDKDGEVIPRAHFGRRPTSERDLTIRRL